LKGIWAWPSSANDQDNTLLKVMREDELATILFALEKTPQGLSNAQLDKMLTNNSQWRTLKHMRELISLGFVQYHVEFFGNAGGYTLTELGKAAIARMRQGPVKHPEAGPDYSLRARFRWDWS